MNAGLGIPAAPSSVAATSCVCTYSSLTLCAARPSGWRIIIGVWTSSGWSCVAGFAT